MTQQSSLVSNWKAALSDKSLHNKIFCIAAICSGVMLLSGTIAMNTGQAFVSGPPGTFDGTDKAVFTASLLTWVISLTLLRKHVKLALHKLFVFLHYTFGAFFGLALVVMVFAFLSEVSADLQSFMTAPVGTKPGYEYSGWGSPWWLYAGAAFGMWILFKFFKALQAESKPSDLP